MDPHLGTRGPARPAASDPPRESLARVARPRVRLAHDRRVGIRHRARCRRAPAGRPVRRGSGGVPAVLRGGRHRRDPSLCRATPRGAHADGDRRRARGDRGRQRRSRRLRRAPRRAAGPRRAGRGRLGPLSPGPVDHAAGPGPHASRAGRVGRRHQHREDAGPGDRGDGRRAAAHRDDTRGRLRRGGRAPVPGSGHHDPLRGASRCPPPSPCIRAVWRNAHGRPWTR